MKKIILLLFITYSIFSLATTDKNMKMKMELDKSNPNFLVINIVPESEEEYERLKKIIENKEKEKSDLKYKEEKNESKSKNVNK